MENTTNSKFKDFILSKAGQCGMIAVLYAMIWGIMVALTATHSTVLAFIYMIVFTYFGWKALNRITPDVFLWMSFTGWIVYFVIKFILSIVIGMFVAPFQIAKMISSTIQQSIA